MKSEIRTPKGHTYKQWVFAILANMNLLSYGMQIGWVSSMAAVLQSPQSPTGAPLSAAQLSWLASAPSLAAVLSVLTFACLVDTCGRKTCIICMALLQAVCWIIKLCPSSSTSLIVARVCAGLAAGGGFNIVPMYVKEISQDSIRGTLGMLLTMCQNIGILVMFAMGGFMDYYTVLWAVAALPVVTALAMTKAPESPTYMVKIGRDEEAASIIAYLRGLSADDKLVQNEIDSIKAEGEKVRSIGRVSFIGIFRQKAWRNGFVRMICLMVIHGLNGGFSLINYASTIVQRSGVAVSPELQSLSIPAFLIIGSLASMTCVDRFGRRPLLATSFISSVVSFSALGGILWLQESGVRVPGWLSVACIVLAVTAYAGGVSPLPFVIMAEMFNFQIRTKIMGCLVTLGWLFSFVQLLAFGPVTSALGAHGAFLCFAAVNLLGAALVLAALPETKGKSVDQIEAELEGLPTKK